MEYIDYYNRVLKEFSSAVYLSQVERAKQEYFALSGTVHENSTLYQERINLFLDWYVFDRHLDDEDLAPVLLFYDLHKKDFSDKEEAVFKNMTSSISGLFIVKKVKRNMVYIKDLFSKKRHVVDDDYILGLVEKGDVFQCRLILFNGRYIFSRGFCFHAPGTAGYIKSEIGKIRSIDESYYKAFMMKLALMRLKVEEYSHIPIEHIYSRKPKVKLYRG